MLLYRYRRPTNRKVGVAVEFKGERSVFKKIIMDENDALSEYNKIPLGHNRTNYISLLHEFPEIRY